MADRPTGSEPDRAVRLLDAQTKAELLFREVSDRGLIRAGIGERALSNEIRDLASDMFGVTRHWHKRIVRSGPNTIEIARANPPDRVIADDDILFLDFGPIFEEWEADFGRTFVLGGDPVKAALRDDLPVIWAAGREHFRAHPDITGEQLFDHVVGLSRAAGWMFGGRIAGHLVGEFPHEKIDAVDIESYIAPGSHGPMRRTDRAGRICHWILEVHLVEPGGTFGGFHEELLDLPDPLSETVSGR
jgi:Xaa-Pro dipeptidase